MLPQLTLPSPKLMELFVIWDMMLCSKCRLCVVMVEKYEVLMSGIQNLSVGKAEEGQSDLAPLVATTLQQFLCQEHRRL